MANCKSRYHEDADTASQCTSAEVDRLVRVDRVFFRRIGVDDTLCWVGKMPPYNASNYDFLSAHDVARFGMANVHTPPDYEQMDVSTLKITSSTPHCRTAIIDKLTR